MAEAFSYDPAAIRIRDDIPEAHRRAWRRLASPGTWWSGADRLAIAAEVRAARTCGLCAERREAVTPHAVFGTHAPHAGPLTEGAVDAIHRITTDPGRLSRSWYESLLTATFTDARYVELVGVVATVVSIDAFHRALGMSEEPLPEPGPGEPSRKRPLLARDRGAWVPMLPQRGARGEEADLWRPPTGNVMRALSLVPDEVRNLNDLIRAHYLPPEDIVNPRAGSRAIDRAQMELVAGRVSALNECFY